ncbi:SulP family inorganic anion transporter [Arsenicicoccus dermatophilus]|uniref:SulP family inorganic anion transporter n=1 Tax=Arsenicicoccus dermatophilus TaxID=1076331 RepID=UPI00391740A4
MDSSPLLSPRFAGWRAVLRYDLPASFVVFLVAVPLSLGIAVASGAPIAAGLLSAAVGGIVAGLLGGSQLQVSGPAAGMVVVVAGLVAEHGWPVVAAVTLGAGVVQILLGLTGMARYALAIPPAVVHGMLAGIGVSICLSQSHVLLGQTGRSTPLDNILALPGALSRTHGQAAALGVATITVLVLWDRLPSRLKLLPGPLVAVGLTTAMAVVLGLDVPRPTLPENILDVAFVPRLSGVDPAEVVVAVFTVALLASIESLLSAVAVDRLHDGPRVDLGRELVGQGSANAVCGALGGLPVTGVIVRSSTNALAGGRTRASAVLHGVWVLVCSVVLASAVEQIPLAALAGLLIHVGAKLVNLAHVRELSAHRDLWPYLATLGGVVLLNLVEGVVLGLLVAFWLLRRRASWHGVTTQTKGGEWVVRIRGSIGFLTVPALVSGLQQVPPGGRARVVIDVEYLDHAAITVLEDWIAGHRGSGGEVAIEEVGTPWLSQAQAGEPIVHREPHTGTVRERVRAWWHRGHRASDSPVLAGVDAFHAERAHAVGPLAELAQAQSPTTLFITCCDSRVLPHLITASGPGDLFVVRSIGNIVPRWEGGVIPPTGSSVAAAVEYAVSVLRVREVVVCGHSSCGAMQAIAYPELPPGLRALEHWLHSVGADLDRAAEAVRSGTMSVDDLARHNVMIQMDNLRRHPVVQTAEGLRVIGLYFDIGEATAHVVSDSGAKVTAD